jgi:putative DNA-invertase from lambdoid prophage Rac
MARIAYYRVSTLDQSIDAQRQALGGSFDREFADEGVSGAVMAAQRPAFAKLLEFIREGDELHVYALDRIGRDALDVQSTVRALLAKGVKIDCRGIGIIAKGVGEIVVAVVAQIADLERQRIMERTESGRAAARVSLALTGKTHRGKESLGRRMSADPFEVIKWRAMNNATISETAEHFDIGTTTVKRYMQRAEKRRGPVQQAIKRLTKA